MFFKIISILSFCVFIGNCKTKRPSSSDLSAIIGNNELNELTSTHSLAGVVGVFKFSMQTPSYCTGFVTAEGLIATANHCLPNSLRAKFARDKYFNSSDDLSEEIRFKLASGSIIKLKKISKKFPEGDLYKADILLFEPFEKISSSLKVLSNSTLRKFNNLSLIGISGDDVRSHLFDNENSIYSLFKISTKNCAIQKTYKSGAITHSCDSLKGSSGGPLFDRDNQLVGIHLGYLSNEKINLAIKPGDLKNRSVTAHVYDPESNQDAGGFIEALKSLLRKIIEIPASIAGSAANPFLRNATAGIVENSLNQLGKVVGPLAKESLFDPMNSLEANIFRDAETLIANSDARVQKDLAIVFKNLNSLRSKTTQDARIIIDKLVFEFTQISLEMNKSLKSLGDSVNNFAGSIDQLSSKIEPTLERIDQIIIDGFEKIEVILDEALAKISITYSETIGCTTKKMLDKLDDLSNKAGHFEILFVDKLKSYIPFRKKNKCVELAKNLAKNGITDSYLLDKCFHKQALESPKIPVGFTNNGDIGDQFGILTVYSNLIELSSLQICLNKYSPHTKILYRQYVQDNLDFVSSMEYWYEKNTRGFNY